MEKINSSVFPSFYKRFLVEILLLHFSFNLFAFVFYFWVKLEYSRSFIFHLTFGLFEGSCTLSLISHFYLVGYLATFIIFSLSFFFLSGFIE